jgi:hypothetical protein
MTVEKTQIAAGVSPFSYPVASVWLTHPIFHFLIPDWLLPCVCICRSVFALFLSVSDHLTYMGVDVAADDWSTCRIVMAQSVEQLRSNLASNIIMSKNPVDIIIVDHSVQIDLSTSS